MNVLTINPNIEPVYWWLTAATIPMWVCALYWNVCATHQGVTESVKIRAATSVLAAIYLVGNLVLLFTDVPPGGWSDVMRGFMLLSIPIVWTQPAKFSVRMAHRIRKVDVRSRDLFDES